MSRLARNQLRPGARVKIVAYTARATQEQALRWIEAARRASCRSVGTWLELIADAEARRSDAERP